MSKRLTTKEDMILESGYTETFNEDILFEFKNYYDIIK